MEPGLKHRVKDSFLQWQMKRSEGLVTFGLRLKSAELAQQVRGTWRREAWRECECVTFGRFGGSVNV